MLRGRVCDTVRTVTDSTVANAAQRASPTDSLSCCRCGYLLRGLDPAGLCPECGTPIVQTIDEVIRRSNRRLLPPPPVHPPLHELGKRSLRLAAAGVALMAVVSVGFACWAAIRVTRTWWWYDPDFLLVWVALGYCVASWIIVAVGKPAKVAPWRSTRLWIYLCAWGAPVAALLLLYSEYVPIWRYQRIAAFASYPAALVFPATWAVFRHLAYLASGSSIPALAQNFRLANALVGVVFLCYALYWPPRRYEIGSRLCALLVLFAYAETLLVLFVVVLLRGGKREDDRMAQGVRKSTSARP